MAEQQDLNAIEEAYINRLDEDNRAYERARLAGLTREARARTSPSLANFTEQDINDANNRITAARPNLPPPPPPNSGAAAAGSGPAPDAKPKTFTLKVFVTPQNETKIKVTEKLKDLDNDIDLDGSIPLTKGITGISSNSLSAIKFAVGATVQQPVDSGTDQPAAKGMFSFFGRNKGGSKKKKRKSTKRRGKTARR